MNSHLKLENVAFTFTAMNVLTVIFWDVTPCSIMGDYKPCRGRCCFHLEHKWKVNADGFLETFIITHAATWWSNLEDHNLSNYEDKPSVILVNSQNMIFFTQKTEIPLLLTSFSNETKNCLKHFDRTSQIKPKWRKKLLHLSVTIWYMKHCSNYMDKILSQYKM